MKSILNIAIVSALTVMVFLAAAPSSVKAASANGYYQFVSGGGEVTINGEKMVLSGADFVGLVGANDARLRIKGNKLPLKKNEAFKFLKQVNGKAKYQGPTALVLRKAGKSFKGSAAFKLTVKVPNVEGIKVNGVVRVKMAMKVLKKKMTLKIQRLNGEIKLTQTAGGQTKTQTIKITNGKGTAIGQRVSK